MNNQQKILLLAAIAGVSAVGLLIILSRRRADEDFDENGDLQELREFPDLTASQVIASASETVVRVNVPQYCVGSIIGKGGENIRQLKRETGARLDFEKENENSDRNEKKERILEIRGEREKVHNAEAKIKQLIAEMPPILTEEMLVPAEACGRIIGKRGDTIKELCQITGARIKVESSSGKSLNGKQRVTLTGNKQQIEYAKGLIQEKVELQKANAYRRPNKDGRKRSPSPSTRPECRTVRLPSTKDYFQAFVSAFDVPGHFYIQLVTQDSSKLDQLTEEMTAYYQDPVASQNESPPSKVVPGDMYCAPFEFDELWYRATVLEVDEKEKMANLFYFDYGDTGKVSFENLRRPKPEYLDLESQAIECFLANVEPNDGKWSEKSIDRFEELSHCAKWSELMARVVEFVKTETGDVPCLELIDTKQEEDINIAEQLVKEGYAVEKGSSQASKENQLPTIKEDTSSQVINNNVQEMTSQVGLQSSPEVKVFAADEISKEKEMKISEAEDMIVQNVVFVENSESALHFGDSSVDISDPLVTKSRDSLLSASSESTEDTVIHVAENTERDAVIKDEVLVEEEVLVESEAAFEREVADGRDYAVESEVAVEGMSAVEKEAAFQREVISKGDAIGMNESGRVGGERSNSESSGGNSSVGRIVSVSIKQTGKSIVYDVANAKSDKGNNDLAVADVVGQKSEDKNEDVTGEDSKDSGVDLESAGFDSSYKKSVSEEVSRWMERSFEGDGKLEPISEDAPLSGDVKPFMQSTELEANLESRKTSEPYRFQQSMEMAKENPIILSDDEDSLSYFSVRSELTVASNANETDTDTMSFKSAPDTPTNMSEFDFPSKNDSMHDYEVITTPVGSDDENLVPDLDATPVSMMTSSKSLVNSTAKKTPRYQIQVIDESKAKGQSSQVASASSENITSPDNSRLSSSPQRISKLSASMPQVGGLKTSQSRFGGSGSLIGKETSI